MDDASLVAAARSGDDTAWAAIYDRYADKLHDHCYRILRDRDEAADALHDAFLAAARNLHQLREPDRLRPWLYSICRHVALRRLKARDRVELTEAVDEMMGPDPDLDRGVRAEELSELVWAAAEGLNGRDQALLDLNLRQGLEGQDLADAMGTSLSNAYVMLSRMRDQVERSLGALLIARLGREDCEELDGLLAGWDGKFTPLLRKRVARHVDSCETCSERRRTAVSPLALLALAPLVPAPSLLKGRVISSIRNVDVVDPPHVPFTKEGFAALGPAEDRSRPKAAWLLGAAAVLLLLGGIFLGARHSGDDKVQTAADSVEPGTRTRATDEPTTTTAALLDPGTGEGTSTTGEPSHDGGTSTSVKGHTGGGSPGTTAKPGGATTTTARPRDTSPPAIGSPSVSFGACNASGARTITVSATITDASTPLKVTLLGGSPPSVGMGGSGTTYSGTTTVLGGQTAQLVIHAVDAAGNKAANRNVSAAVPSCATTTTTTTAPTTTSAPTTVVPG
jgi:RNA polymerase sigma factor (sigma-70 family)